MFKSFIDKAQEVLLLGFINRTCFTVLAIVFLLTPYFVRWKGLKQPFHGS